jgi:hypothetical protein
MPPTLRALCKCRIKSAEGTAIAERSSPCMGVNWHLVHQKMTAVQKLSAKIAH